ncbi:MAG: hypothetical protein ACOC6N_03965, partial [archaeon]
AEGLKAKNSREQFITVQIKEGKVHRVYKQSGSITSMTHADGYILLPIGETKIEEGDLVEVTLLNV